MCSMSCGAKFALLAAVFTIGSGCGSALPRGCPNSVYKCNDKALKGYEDGLSGLALKGNQLWIAAEGSTKEPSRLYCYSLAPNACERSVLKWEPNQPTEDPTSHQIESLAWRRSADEWSLWAGLEGTNPPLVVKLDLHMEKQTFSISKMRHEVLESDWPEAHFGGEGVEALCAAGDHLIAIVEQDGTDWLPLVLLTPTGNSMNAATARLVFAMRPHGRIAGLDCRLDGRRIKVLAIEGYKSKDGRTVISRLLAFSIGAPMEKIITLSDDHIVMDLAELHRGDLNIEGIVWPEDRPPFAINDNRFRSKLDGKSLLLQFFAPISR